MTAEIYSSVLLNPEGMSRFVAADADISGSFLHILAGGQDASGADARELEDFLRQRQTHILGRADAQ